jgi:cytochrome c peroxidase
MYGVKSSAAYPSLFEQANYFLTHNSDFDTFDRMAFLTEYLVPLSEAFTAWPGFDASHELAQKKPFVGSLKALLSGRGFDADYYASYAFAGSNKSKVALGEKLFFDKTLSRSATTSCATCHQPKKFFTDGKSKASNFVHGGHLLRNTPSLYYSSLQTHQFYDHRSVTLEDQANEVMNNGDEFNFSASELTQRIAGSTAYRQLFETVFGRKDTITGFEIRNALAAYVRSLNPFSSAFDAYMQGNKAALTVEQVKGFNLFTGKAKCATCHFLPLFNGNIPPWFNKSESEIIGVPASVKWSAATLDKDSGRYRINRLDELQFAFKTPTVRNAENTAPYMHNGVFKTLDDVVEFYNKGGGAGLDIYLPSQTLPFDSLTLSAEEKRAITAFLTSLTDGVTRD